MFTGIIEEVGVIRAVRRGAHPGVFQDRGVLCHDGVLHYRPSLDHRAGHQDGIAHYRALLYRH